jgi:threonyl-tRNA synthetase
MVTLTFPDGARREFPDGISGLDVAKGISPSLAKRTVAMALDGSLADLADLIERDARIEFLTREDKRALELIRHDAAHVLAEAVQTLWPGTQVTIGPVIENGFYYDFFRNQPFTPEDFPAIEAEMRKIIARDRPFTKEVWAREKAKQVFRDKGELFKVELVDAIPAGEPIKIYKQGDWFDLCRGPHMTSTGKVGAAFKLMKTAGAYWRGDARNPMLTRIYGTAWPSQAELDAYLKQIEEAEKRDHRRLGREMDLFHFQEEAPGSVFWHANGWTLFRMLEDYIRRRQSAAGYLEVNAPQLMDTSLWVASGHMETFREAMFLTQPREDDERVFVVKPMNCPGHIQIFKNGLKSYRDLPFKLAEFGKVHRFEPSGALHGLMRVRAFTQDDAHVFITEDQIAPECLAMNDLILSIYEDFGFSDVSIKFSDRPEKRIGADDVWDKAEAALKQALEGSKRPWTLNKGEGAFYGPKLEYVLRDAIGRDWQCGTVQVDLNMPGRLGAFYIDDHSSKVTPVMLHRAMFGSLERFTGIMIEHYAGHLPLWLAPVQAVVATITSDADDYARAALASAQRLGLRVEADLRNEKINYKVREHSLAKIPVLLVVGKKEAADRAVSIRRLGSQQQTVMPLDRALAMLAEEAVAPDVRRMQQAATTSIKMSQIKLSPQIEKAVAAFHDASTKRMAEANEADEPKEPLFHYTDEGALSGIIESETFRLTSIYHMDDSEELTFGFNVARSLLQAAIGRGDALTRLFCEELVDEEDLTKIKKLFEFYSISFGTRNDKQQWDRYADNGRGVAVGLAPTFFRPLPIANPKPEEKIFCGKVVYGDQQARARHSKVIDAAIETIKQAHAAGSIRNGEDARMFFRHIAAEMTVEILWNCVTTKDIKWRHQNETRLLALNNLKEPHLPIHNVDKRPRVEIPQPLLKKNIVEIMMGPHADDAAEQRVRKFLEANGLSHVSVTRAGACEG